MLNYSEACDRNQTPILQILQRYLRQHQRVLEIGSGSGQHALHFTHHLPTLHWQPTELPENLAALRENLARYGNPCIAPPISLDVRQHDDKLSGHDVVFTANTLHIMSWDAVQQLVQLVARVLDDDGLLIIYGPFKYQQHYTSDSNARFDRWLQARDPASGIRNFEDLEALTAGIGMRLLDDWPMPANNQCLIWQKQHNSS